jgi:hypothetical protein
MREIKFRGLRTDGKGCVYGQLAYFFNNKEMPYIMPDCFFGTKEFGEEDDNGNPIIENDFLALGGFVSVKPDSVGQFTGVHDKNGKEIYEGDLYKDEHEDLFEVVRLDCGRYALKFLDNDYVDELIDWSCIEVIGNIHENPELL